MQETRQHILEILRELGQATVDDIVAELCKRRGKITAVTVRHHLTRLQQEELISTPQLRHRDMPGRPQHVFSLTKKAREHFPNNYPHLVQNLLEQLRQQLSPTHLDRVFAGVADNMAAEAQVVRDVPLVKRLDQVVDYLNKHGYSADWEENETGLALHVYNCPYFEIPGRTGTLCSMDMQLIASLVEITPQVQSRVSEGGTHCVYLIANEHRRRK